LTLSDVSEEINNPLDHPPPSGKASTIASRICVDKDNKDEQSNRSEISVNALILIDASVGHKVRY